MSEFPQLAAPIRLRGCEVKNRLFFPPHGTSMVEDGKVSNQLRAYHESRAAGGAGLIILEGMSPHHTFDDPSRFISAGDPGVIPGFKNLARGCHAHGCKVFGQLFHGGSSIRSSLDGSRRPVFGPSAIPHMRYGSTAVAASNELVWEWVEAYGRSASHLAAGDLDGIEVLASMGYLISQFLNPHSNFREDEFGGSFENRIRFLCEVLKRIRESIDDTMPVGVRLSAEEFVDEGLTPEEVLDICIALDERKLVDYISVIGGSSAAVSGWIHVFPPMAIPHAYLAEHAAVIKQHVGVPVFVTGRINQPQLAEQILAAGQADMVGAARAMICDPAFVGKTLAGRSEDVRACIGCNQACVGHRTSHFPVSCIQHPESGRELQYGTPARAASARNVAVVGGGPAGMKTAAVAAARGHTVTLYESSNRLGGQALLAQMLPGRAEFGGIITNLTREVERAGVNVIKSTLFDTAMAHSSTPDVVVVATGAVPRVPPLETDDAAHVVDAWSVINGEANVGASVVVADWVGDWVGLGVAESLVRAGCQVKLVVNAAVAGASIHDVVRDQWIGELHKLGVEMIPFAKVFGADEDTVYFTHIVTGEPIVIENIETLVLAQGHTPVNTLADDLKTYPGEVMLIGDALSPRTAEEAVLDGLKAGTEI